MARLRRPSVTIDRGGFRVRPRPPWHGTGIDRGPRQGAKTWRQITRAGTPLLRIVDGSNWQPDDLTPALRNLDGGIFQAGVGRFDEHVQQSLAMGKVTGAYCWFYPQRDVGAELARFEAAVAPYAGRLALRVWVDVETTPGLATPSAQHNVDWLHTWYGRRPADGVYTSPGEWGEMTGGNAGFGAQELWEADYGVNQPAPMPGWASGWAGWQFTSSGSAGGIANLDLSLFSPAALVDQSPGGLMGTFATFIAIPDPKRPPDASGRVAHWQVDHKGGVYAFNGARPIPALGAVGVNRSDIAGAYYAPAGSIPGVNIDALVLTADDGHQEGGAWVASAYVQHATLAGVTGDGRRIEHATVRYDGPAAAPA